VLNAGYALTNDGLELLSADGRRYGSDLMVDGIDPLRSWAWGLCCGWRISRRSRLWHEEV
jgi:hypothetical protein